MIDVCLHILNHLKVGWFIKLFEFKTMTLLQSEINVLKARIKQYEESELFSESERKRLVVFANQELEILLEKQLNTEPHANTK